MNCINLTKRLNDIDSLKIEGRRRTERELIKVINEIKNSYSSDEQKGYLYGNQPEEHRMYEKINHRIKPIYNLKDIENVDEKDVFIEFKEGVPHKFVQELNRKNEDIKYVYSEYKNSYKTNKNNLFFVMDIKDTVIQKIDYTNYKGEFKSFYLKDNKDLINISIDDFVKAIKEISKDINLYKVRYIRNLENKYMISNEMLNELLQYVKNDNIIKSYPKKENKIRLKMIYMETDNLDVVENFIEDKFVKIIYNLNSMEEVDKIVSKYNDRIIYKLPLFNWKSNNYNNYYQKLIGKEIMFTRLSQIETLKNIKLKKKYIDYSIYVWNSETLKFLKKCGIEEFTASPELNYEQNNNIFENENVQFILCGKLPLVYTRSCFKEVFNCKKCNLDKLKVKKIKNVSKDLNFEILCKKDYRTILFNKPILNDYSKFDIENTIKFRYVATNQNLNEILETIQILKEKDFIEKLLKTDVWKEAYENNLIVSRA